MILSASNHSSFLFAAKVKHSCSAALRPPADGFTDANAIADPNANVDADALAVAINERWRTLAATLASALIAALTVCCTCSVV